MSIRHKWEFGNYSCPDDPLSIYNTAALKISSTAANAASRPPSLRRHFPLVSHSLSLIPASFPTELTDQLEPNQTEALRLLLLIGSMSGRAKITIPEPIQAFASPFITPRRRLHELQLFASSIWRRIKTEERKEKAKKEKREKEVVPSSSCWVLAMTSARKISKEKGFRRKWVLFLDLCFCYDLFEFCHRLYY